MSKELLQALYKSNATLQQESFIKLYNFVQLIIINTTDDGYLFNYNGTNNPTRANIPYLPVLDRYAPCADLARMLINRLERAVDKNGQYFYPPTAEVSCQCLQCLSLEEENHFECDECRRNVPYCFGADDDYYELCDDCANEKFAIKEAILDLSLGNSIDSVDILWLALKIKLTDEFDELINSLFIGGKVQAIARLQTISGMLDRAFSDALPRL